MTKKVKCNSKNKILTQKVNAVSDTIYYYAAVRHILSQGSAALKAFNVVIRKVLVVIHV